MRSVKKEIAWVGAFAIAMGFMESAVVIYLRELYYPDGFRFPLNVIPASIARVEFLRELATVIMLVTCGYMAGKSALQRFAYFALAFAVWDIFYYVFLYVFLGWPQSPFTWDILFLIPVPWVGPVWAPCLLSLLMITGAVLILLRTEKSPRHHVAGWQWLLMISGVLICILAFTWDYLEMLRHCTESWTPVSKQELFAEMKAYVPSEFKTGLFLTGFFTMCIALFFHLLKPVKS